MRMQHTMLLRDVVDRRVDKHRGRFNLVTPGDTVTQFIHDDGVVRCHFAPHQAAWIEQE